MILLDISFLVALEMEVAAGEAGPAVGLLRRLRGQRATVSVITVGELLEGAVDGRRLGPRSGGLRSSR